MEPNPWDWTRPDEELAARLVAEPLSTDFFLGHPAGDLIVGRNGAPQNPARYARLFLLASGLTTNPAMRLACLVEHWNGRRRPPNAADHNEVAAVYAAIHDEITRELPSGPVKFLLAGAVCYNLGIVYRGLRRYLQAGNSQLASAGWLIMAGRQDKALTALFVAAVEYVSDALCGGDPMQIAAQLEHLRQMREVIRATCPEYPRWMKENATLHIWLAHLLVEQDYPELEADRAELSDWKLPAAYAPYQRLFQVTELGDLNERVAAADTALASPEVTRTGFASVVLSLKIYKARVLLELDRTDEARAVLTEVMGWTGVDGGAQMELASRLLQTLTA